MNTLKALTLWEPWASLCLATDAELPFPVAAKEFETRSWDTSHRGPLLIHAAKRWRPEQRDIASEEPFRRILRDWTTTDWAEPDTLGCILGVVILDAIHRTEDVKGALSPGDKELAFGDYTKGRKAWKLTHPRRFDEPVPWRGHQQLWNVDREDLPPHARRTIEVLG